MRLFILGSFIQACCWQVERLPKPGETVTALALSMEPGGKGLNVAIGARRLGAEVDVLLGIGRDEAGDALLRLLIKERLDAQHVWRLSNQSGHGAGLIAADGQNMIAICPGPNQLLTEQHVQAAEQSIGAADIVYGQLETSLMAVSAAFHLAKRYGARTVLNPSPWQELPQHLLDATDVLIVNEVEAKALLALDSSLPGSLPACLRQLRQVLASFWLKWDGSLLVVTMGGAGSLVIERDGQVHHVPSFAVKAVDSVGCGDAFASAFLIELGNHAPLVEALRYGNACGAIMASNCGVLEVLPGQAELQDFLLKFYFKS
ncbi:MAG: ribokinase [Methylovulum sp.]|uniref:ribokinase n=1 Tax=Methylovulum sp. TaxID=1916980 RepID=UPI00260B64D0|nr:ribokinase [Methylovulum sp.]MDD2724992.1 ribokinase [Methylovulum sp.]MDD5126435.1 ribokinase [Methylovulum sp.]